MHIHKRITFIANRERKHIMITDRIARVAFLILIPAFITGLFGCDELISTIFEDINLDDDSDGSVVVVEVPEQINVGLVLPLTGSVAASSGLPMQRGYHLARDEINSLQLSGARINFVTIDDMSTVEGQVDAFNQLVGTNVHAIVGMSLSTQAGESFPIAQEKGIVVLSSSVAASGLGSIGDYIFRTSLAVDILNPRGVEVTHAALGYERAAMVYDDADVFSTSSHEELHSALVNRGVEILTVQTCQTGDTDFTEQLTAIVASNPDVLFVSALSREVIGIMKQGRELGLPTSVRYIVPELGALEVERVGDAAEGTITFTSWISTSDAPGNQRFVGNYRAAYGMEPEPWAAQSYAALYILHAAISAAQYKAGAVAPSPVLSTDSTAIRDMLATAQNIDTILGTFSFDANGDAVYDPHVLTVRDGEFEVFE